MNALTVNVYSHHFAVSGYSRQLKDLIVRWLDEFAEYTYNRRWNGSVVRTLSRFYAVSTADRREFRIHISVLDRFLASIQNAGYGMESIEIIRHDPPPATLCEILMEDHVQPRNYQIPLVAHMVAPGSSKVITLQTGMGKTLCALLAASELGMRTVIVIKGMYVDRWLKDLTGPESVIQGGREDVLVVRGARDLKALIALGLDESITAKFIIITNTTMRAFFDQYENFNRDYELYGCYPYEFFGVIGAGVRIIDEVHQDFHLNFRQDLYTNIQKTICLSATLEADSDFINHMYATMFPNYTRVDNGVYKRYIAVSALLYSLRTPHSVRYTMKGRHTYNHIAFEDSVLQDRARTRNYLEIVQRVVYEYYIRVYQQGQRMLVFAGSVEMCSLIVDDLRQRYPALTISKYTSEDEYEVLLSSDITVSTLLSAGTAVDVPGLRVCLVTTAIGSSQANLQALGRLRELRQFPDVTPEFLYLVCTDIKPHMDYHARKQATFRGKALTHKTVLLGMNL